MPGIDDYAKSLQQDNGQRFDQAKTNLSSMKNLYPAIVVNEEDPTELRSLGCAYRCFR